MNPPNIKWIWNLFIYVGFSRIGKSSNMCHTGKNTGAYVMSIVDIDRHTYILSSWVMCSKRFWYHILAWTRINGSFVCTCRVFYWVNGTVASWCDDCFFRIPAVGWLEFGSCGRYVFSPWYSLFFPLPTTLGEDFCTWPGSMPKIPALEGIVDSEALESEFDTIKHSISFVKMTSQHIDPWNVWNTLLRWKLFVSSILVCGSMASECLSFELPSMSLFDRSEKSHAKAMFLSRDTL